MRVLLWEYEFPVFPVLDKTETNLKSMGFNLYTP